MSSHDLCPPVAFSLERKEWEEGNLDGAGNLDASTGNQFAGFVQLAKCFCLFLFSILTPYSVTVIITNLVPVRI